MGKKAKQSLPLSSIRSDALWRGALLQGRDYACAARVAQGWGRTSRRFRRWARVFSGRPDFSDWLQLSALRRVFFGMNSFLKIFLLVVLALVAIKLLPLTLAMGCVLGLAVAGLVLVGVSALAGMLAVAVGIVAALAPLWIPVLAIAGLIAVIRRFGPRTVAA